MASRDCRKRGRPVVGYLCDITILSSFQSISPRSAQAISGYYGRPYLAHRVLCIDYMLTPNQTALFLSSLFPYLAAVIRNTARKGGLPIADADVDDIVMTVTERVLASGVESPAADDPQNTRGKGYLATIAHNATVDFLKSHGTQVAYRAARLHTVGEEDTSDVSEILPAAYVSAERRMMARDVLMAVSAHIETMAPADRALAMEFVSEPDGFDSEAYAARTGQTGNAVKIRLCRVRKALQAAVA